MLYKEWTSVRFKFYLWAAIYGALVLSLLTFWSPWSRFGNSWYKLGYPLFIQPVYLDWLNFSSVVIILTALLGGVDMISDELDKGTLSFLLTRPITRRRIYTTKILINLLGLGAIYGLSSAVMLTFDQLQPKSVNLLEGLGLTLVVYAIGAILICLAGLISVFTRNALQTISLTIAIPFSLVILVALNLYTILPFIGTFTGTELKFQPNLSAEMSLTLLAIAMIGTIAGLFWSGLVAFSRKEF